MIEINSLEKTYGDFKLEIDNLQFNEGEVIGLVGNNGAGKTTFLSLLLDLIQRTKGNIKINDIDVTEGSNWKNITGAYLNSSFLLDFLTPEEYFLFLFSAYGIKDQELNSLSKYNDFFRNEVIDKKKLIRDFSSGNQQKIGIIGALLHDPKIIVFDEPISNLDPSAQKEFKKIIRGLNNDRIIVISSHDLNLVSDLCNRVILIENGKIKKDYCCKLIIEDLFKEF